MSTLGIFTCAGDSKSGSCAVHTLIYGAIFQALKFCFVSSFVTGSHHVALTYLELLFVAPADLKLRGPPASSSQVLD